MVTDELVQLTALFLEDTRLRRWFVTLRQLPPDERAERLARLITKMTARREPLSTITALSALRFPEVYRAVEQTLEEHEHAERLVLPSLRTSLVIMAALLIGTFGVFLFRRSLGDERLGGVTYFWPGAACLVLSAALILFTLGKSAFFLWRDRPHVR